MVRDDFSKSVIRKLAENSSYICNNPDCRQITIYNTSGDKSSKCGIAAHICAASKNGPRYEALQTPAERSSDENGVWLCANCSYLIDRDVERYSKELLLSWKEKHPKWLLENNNFRPYEDLISKFNEISNRLLEKNKSIHKYIPELYSEISSVKEFIRFFSNPCVFWNKIIELLDSINFKYLHDFSSEFEICSFNFDYPKEIKRNLNLEEMYDKSLMLDDFLSEKKKELSHFQEIVYAEETIKSMSSELQDKYENLKYKHYITIINYKFKIEKIAKLNKAIHSQILLITSSAGKGKTNFLCDISSNFLGKCNIPFIFVNASELDRIDEIGSYFLKLTYLNRDHKYFEHFASNYQSDFETRNKILVIIIDGLNEVTNIKEFDEKLSEFATQIYNYRYIKLICTCRSEFFDHRFKQFNMLSSSKLLVIRDFNKEMNEDEKSNLLKSYLIHFHISIKRINMKIYNKLTENPLLLRIFSEVNENASINNLNHLYTETVFRKYFDLKIGSITEPRECYTPISIQKSKTVKDIFRKIIQLMITNKEYINIKINDLNLREDEIEELSRIINEDIMLKKDIETDDVLSSSQEIINFTFDEMRDFLIANQLINISYKENPVIFSDFLDKFLIRTSSIYEGVSRFTFNISKKKNDEILIRMVESQPWFEDVFVEEIFNVEDEYITSIDIEKIKYLFLKSNSYCTKLFLELTSNPNSQDKLNISIIFDILKTMSNEQYDLLLKSSFIVNSSGYNDKEKIELSNFFTDLDTKLVDELDDEDPIHYFFELLILLMGADEPIKSKSYKLFIKYFKIYPHKCEILFTDFESIKVSTIKEKLQKIQA